MIVSILLKYSFCGERRETCVIMIRGYKKERYIEDCEERCWQPFSRKTAFTSFSCFQSYTFSFSPKRKFECEVLKVKITDSTFPINNITIGIYLWLIKCCYFWCLMKTGIAVGNLFLKEELPCKPHSRQF